MADLRALPILPLTVRVPVLYAHLVRRHEWDDPGWLPKRPGTIRAYAQFHYRADKKNESRE